MFINLFFKGMITTLTSFLLLASCGGTPDKPDTYTVTDLHEEQGVPITETLNANNCTGADNMQQNLEAKKQFTHEIQITAEAGVSYNPQALENAIRESYNLYDISTETVCLVPIQVPAGVFYSYDLEWIEVWREGNWDIGDADDTPEGTYRFRQSMLCEVVGQKTEPCP